MLEQHKGGEEFFNHLDIAIQQYPIVYQLLIKLNTFRNKEHMYSPRIIASGKFGRFFRNYFKLPDIVVNGDLRKGKTIDDLSYMKEMIKDQDFIFIDDSFYSGKTRMAINNELSKYNGKIIQTFVVYDGSIEKDDTVQSLYRYHK